ncbi:Lar family restriction alleviation protein (plasmid) [Cupriavidus pinatubonensis]|uniref:Lar family restriction alleviation protein n=1 Tax=Cupriavidus pinatubonensis TaxID=248026 RepID=UPI001C73C389|nr:Lar family restriction alleviation protein [Cupriavidus pinatubonensis]QYY33699.1 Lar family restriction alleviation protein [Cupriavidus pinatubonensis]
MNEQLRLCGCGAVPRMSNYEGSAIHVSCRCGLQLWGAKAHFGSEAEAIAAWNKRAGAAAEPVAWRYRTITGWHTTTDAGKASRLKFEHGYEVEALAVMAKPEDAAHRESPGRLWGDLR